MKNISLCFLLFLNFIYLNAQKNYLNDVDLQCDYPTNERIREIFPLGVESVKINKYLGAAIQIFNDVIEIDSSFCDAYFWSGNAYKQSNMPFEAFVMYYMADSLTYNKSTYYKLNLAQSAMEINEYELARKKYEEVKTYFPENSYGFTGVALTSTVLGDVEYGLENILIAETKLYIEKNKDIQLLKAVLLTMNDKHEEALPFYEKARVKYLRNDLFNAHYAVSLFEVGTQTNDEKLVKQAKKYFKKVKNKDEIKPEIRAKLEEK